MRVPLLLVSFLVACEIFFFSSIAGAQSEVKRCAADGTCSTAGTLRSCGLNADCQAKNCEGGQCFPGGRGVSCFNNDDCDQKRCYANRTCNFGGTGRPCNTNSDCPEKTCDYQYRCVADSTGTRTCSADADCAVTKGCSSSSPSVCQVNGPERNCSSDGDCSYKTCAATTCTYHGYIIDSRICSTDQECATGKSCALNHCAQNRSGTAHCDGNADCRHGECPISATCVSADGPGLSQCTPGTSCSPTSEPDLEFSLSDEENALQNSAERMFIGSGLNLASSMVVSVGGEFIGYSEAPITIVMFQDLKCGMCKRAFQTVFPYIRERFINTQMARFAFLDYPLTNTAGERALARGAHCAGQQGAYLPFLAYLYGNMSSTQVDRLVHYARLVGSDSKTFESCMTSNSYESIIDSSISIGNKLGVQGTPTFFINNRALIGAQPLETFDYLIRSELRKVAQPS